MPVLTTQLDTGTEAFQRNRDHMLAALAELDRLYAEAAAGGGEETLARLRKRGKMPLRERISLVLDPDSAFLEISPLAAWRSNFNVGSGFVVGIGVIEGVEVETSRSDNSERKDEQPVQPA